MGLLVGLIVSACGPALAADNAVITGDSVRVRTQPSVWEDIRGTLNKGARVEVISRTDFTDTIDGYAAPWYGIDYGQYGGFVFGRYVKLDPGATVLPLPTNDIYGDRVSRFIARGLYKFGKGTPDVIATLGQPISTRPREGRRADRRGGDPYLHRAGDRCPGDRGRKDIRLLG